MVAPITARKHVSNFIASTGPDVCLTPMGSSVVPVAYSSIAFFDKAVRTSSDVNDNALADFHLNARAKWVYGHEAGREKGVAVRGYKKAYAAAIQSSAYVAINGYPVVRDGDPAMINSPTPDPKEIPAEFEQEKIQISSWNT